MSFHSLVGCKDAMPGPDVARFLDYLRQSLLIEELQWPQAAATAALAESSRQAADLLVAKGLLTRWQADKLLAGRHRGFRLGKYRLRELLGAGGMSRVYLAEHIQLKIPVAIKVLPLAHASDPQYRQRFLREARAAASLRHPNIIQAFDVDQEGSIHYLVMEYVPGVDLHRLVQAHGPLPQREAADIVRQAALGLQHAHANGLIHRDVKPANLLIDPHGNVKVLDLGLALFHDDASGELTAALGDRVLGTADYIAPEQGRDSHAVDGRADVYSLGCTLYYALVGSPPFPGGTAAEKIRRHLRDRPAPLGTLRSDIDDPLQDICSRMMEKNPRDRFPTAGAVALALQAYLDLSSAADDGDPKSATVSAPLLLESVAANSRGAPSPKSRLGASLGEPPPRPDDAFAGAVRDTTIRMRNRNAVVFAWTLIMGALVAVAVLGYLLVRIR